MEKKNVNTLRKCFVFGSLYFSEGISSAISSVVLPLYLAHLGFPAGIVGLAMSVTTIPWVIKIAWGLLVDEFSHFGRRNFILAGGIIGAAMNLLMFALHPSFLPLIVALIFIARCGVATLDVSTDAFAISISKPHERGKINGSQFAGQLLGYAFGSVYLTRLTSISYPVAFFGAAMFILMFTSTVFLLKEVKIKPSLGKLKEVFASKHIWLVILAIVLINLPTGFLGIAAYYMKTALALKEEIVGNIMMIAGVINALGSFAGGALSDKYGRIKVLYVVLLLFAISIAPAYFDFLPFYMLNAFFSGAIASVLCAYCMDITRKEIAATEYAVFTSVANLGWVIGMMPSGYILELAGNWLFVVAAVSVVPALFALRILKKVPQ